MSILANSKIADIAGGQALSFYDKMWNCNKKGRTLLIPYNFHKKPIKYFRYRMANYSLPKKRSKKDFHFYKMYIRWFISLYKDTSLERRKYNLNKKNKTHFYYGVEC